jgi:putative ATP-dependent endonuclease of the OLD family
LRRAVDILPESEDRSRLRQAFRDVLTSSDEGDRTAIVDELGQHGLFVGQQTLELDLCSLLGDQMIAAFNELPATVRARQDLAAGVANERSRTPQATERAAMLRRIETVGKGRYAQRLAAYIADSDLAALVEESGGDPTTEPIEAGPASYLLNALDRVSWIVRGRPLLAEAAPEGGD